MQGNPAKAHVLYADVEANDQAERLLSATRIHVYILSFSNTLKGTQGTIYCHLSKAGYNVIQHG